MKTEHPSPRFADIDLWKPHDILEGMIGGQFTAVAAVREALPHIENAALAMETRLRSKGRIIYAGAGTSGRLAVQDGAELMPTFGWSPDRLLLLIAGGDEAMVQAVEGAEDQAEHAADLVRRHAIGPDDSLIAVAASGTTPFTLACLREATQRKALTIGIANNPDTPILRDANHGIFLDTGAEPIAGSTRMNAGTAQRITLNLLSTLLMIRLGRVYRGLMIEVQATNSKLTKRKKDMLLYLTGKSEDVVQDALVRAGGRIKVAVLLLHGCNIDKAEELLGRSAGQLRAAMDLAGVGA